MEALEDTWRNLQKIIEERDGELNKEAHRQEENDKLRKEFAKHANLFHQWLTETRYDPLKGHFVVSVNNDHVVTIRTCDCCIRTRR